MFSFFKFAFIAFAVFSLTALEDDIDLKSINKHFEKETLSEGNKVEEIESKKKEPKQITSVKAEKKQEPKATHKINELQKDKASKVHTDKSRLIKPIPEANSIIGTKKDPNGILDAKNVSKMPVYPAAYSEKYKTQSTSPYKNPLKNDPKEENTSSSQKQASKKKNEDVVMPALTNKAQSASQGNILLVKSASASEINEVTEEMKQDWQGNTNLQKVSSDNAQKSSVKDALQESTENKANDTKSSENIVLTDINVKVLDEDGASDADKTQERLQFLQKPIDIIQEGEKANRKLTAKEVVEQDDNPNRNTLREATIPIPAAPKQDVQSLEYYAKEFEFGKDKVKYDVKTYVTRTKQNADKGQIGYDTRQVGAYTEAGGIFSDDLRLSLAYGYSDGDVDLESGAGHNMDISSQYFGLNFHYDLSKYYLKGTIGGVFNDYERKFGGNDSVSFDGTSVVLGLAGGFRLPLQNGFLLVPNVFVRYMDSVIDAHKDGLGNNYDERNISRTAFAIGTKVQYPIILNDIEILPEARLNWLYDIVAEDRGGSAFLTLPGNNVLGPIGSRYSKAISNLGFGVKAKIAETFFLGLDYDLEAEAAGGDLFAHTLQAYIQASF